MNRTTRAFAQLLSLLRFYLGRLLIILVSVFFYGVVLAQSTVVWFSFDAEAGSLSGQAQRISDALAANGQAIHYTNGGGQVQLPNPGAWTNVTSNLSGMATECGELTMLSAVPDGSGVIAGVARRGLFKSTNNGASWLPLGTGAGSAAVDNRPNSIVYDPLNPAIFWVSGPYGPGVFKTTNGGQTFQRLGDISHNDTVSVDFTDPQRQTLVAGGHEQGRTVYKSTNGGQTWTNIGGSLADGNQSSTVHVINAQTYLVATSGWGGGTALYRTTNGGASWQVVSTAKVSTFNPGVGASGTIYWPAWENNGSILKSTDNGATWTQTAGGIKDVAPVELLDGRLVTFAGNRMVVSTNGGASWTQFGATMPYSDAAGVVYVSGTNSYFVSHWGCGTTVPSDAIMRLQ